ncbi:MAG: VOC family protein [Acidobacteria bacterium]|nr:VOC family protein [Acidobacteriota bacterium]
MIRNMVYRGALGVAAFLSVSAPGMGFAQSAPVIPWASDGPVVHGHHHFNITDRAAHGRFWSALGGTPTPWRDVQIFKFPNALIFLTERAPSAGTIGSTVNHVGFWVPDARATLASLRDAGYPLITARELPDADVQDDVYCPQGADYCLGFVLGPDDVKVEIMGNRTQSMPIQHHHIHFNSPNVDSLRAWYVEMFGAIPGMNGNFKVADLPGVNLRFSETALMAGTEGRSLDHIGFEVDGLEAFCRELASKGVIFDRPYGRVDELGLGYAFLRDPEGTYIELTEGLDKY